MINEIAFKLIQNGFEFRYQNIGDEERIVSPEIAIEVIVKEGKIHLNSDETIMEINESEYHLILQIVDQIIINKTN